MSGMVWAVTDSWTMTRRGLAHWARQPVQIIVQLVFPVLLLLMFGYFLGGGMAVPGGGGYKEYLVPGMFALTMAFGLESTMIAVTQDLGKGCSTASGRCRWRRPRCWSDAASWTCSSRR